MKRTQNQMDNIVVQCMENTSKLKDLSKAIVIQTTHQQDTNKTIRLMRCFLEMGEACDFNLLLLANKSPNTPHYFTFLQKMMKRGETEFQKLERDPSVDSKQFAELRATFESIQNNMKQNFARLRKN